MESFRLMNYLKE